MNALNATISKAEWTLDAPYDLSVVSESLWVLVCLGFFKEALLQVTKLYQNKKILKILYFIN